MDQLLETVDQDPDGQSGLHALEQLSRMFALSCELHAPAQQSGAIESLIKVRNHKP
jgi:hypothetical protein